MTARLARGAVGALRIRAARAPDVARVAEIERASFSDPWSEASFASLVGERLVAFAVAEVDGAIGGYSVVWTAADEAELANVAVTPAVRGLGVGRALVVRAMRTAADRGAVMMFLEVRESNAVARALYESCGFALVGRRRRYYRRPDEDALVLRATLDGG